MLNISKELNTMADPTINPNTDAGLSDLPAYDLARDTVTNVEASPEPIPPATDPEVEYYQEQQRQNEFDAAQAIQGSPAEINPEEDPEELARLNAQAGLDDPPTEQTVIDNDPGVYAALNAADDGTTQGIIDAGAEDYTGEYKYGTTAGQTTQVQAQATKQDTAIFQQAKDWRVRLSLAPGAQYLYNVASQADVLFPLKSTNGVVFPYTPTINVTYAASYDPTELTHTNYKFYQYRSSYVGDVQITADFTAQDTTEAKYLLAVVHFFKSVTKMFYGKDTSPVNGVPPPLCFLSGYGPYQFDNHPLAITNFNYSLPNDVDYIRAGSSPVAPGVNLGNLNKNNLVDKYAPGLSRLFASGLKFGGVVAQPAFTDLANTDATYVPTKMQIVITGVPIVSRNNVSNVFSLRDYATGKLNRGSKNNTGGMW